MRSGAEALKSARRRLDNPGVRNLRAAPRHDVARPRAARRLIVPAALLIALVSCASPGPTSPPGPGPQPPPAASDTWNLDSLGAPRFVATDYIDLSRIASVSRFRSGYGHDYSDGVEHCRSMKHYYVPTDWPQAGTIPIAAPVSGVVTRLIAEWAGTQVQIQPLEYRPFTVILFHVNLVAGIAEGDTLAAGQSLGTHIGSQTASDVAVRVATPGGVRLISWFDVMSDGLFATYLARGATSRAQFLVSAAERDAAPLQCDSLGTFANPGSLENWVDLSSLPPTGRTGKERP